MHLIVVGINFKTADVEVREKLHFSNDVIADALAKLNTFCSVKGSVILSTCNRVEIYASVDVVKTGFDDVVQFISEFHHIPQERLIPFLYQKNCQAAVVHLFKVAASLDSMVIGEYQIQGQVRDAYYEAQACSATNSMLNKVFQTAIQIGKKVRSETNIGAGSVSVATLAVDMVKKVFEDKTNVNILLIGAGKFSNLTAANFQQEFADCSISVTNRSVEKATEMAHRLNGKVIEYHEKVEKLADYDVILASTSAPNYIITKEDLVNAGIKFDDTKVFIDLSIPRNIDPEINSIENCMVFSIDDINKLIDANLEKRSGEIEKAEEIISEISEDYYQWYSKQFIIPTMMEIKKELKIIKNNVMSYEESFMKSLDDKQKEVLSTMFDNYTDRIIKVIMVNFRKSNSKEDLIAMTKNLKHTFTLDVSDNPHQHPHNIPQNNPHNNPHHPHHPHGQK